jgi:hypothetical protein
MTTEPFDGTVHFLGVRASFAKAKELLAGVLEDDECVVAGPLREEISAFLAQFEADA